MDFSDTHMHTKTLTKKIINNEVNTQFDRLYKKSCMFTMITAINNKFRNLLF